MRHLKIGGLVVVAMAAAMALAAPAFATVATSPQGTPYTGKLKGSSENGHLSLTGPLGIAVQCFGTLEGNIEGHGSSVTGTGKGEKWAYECTNGYIVHSVNVGTIEIHSLGSGKGTITSNGTTGLVTNTPIGTCGYLTTNTDLGTVTDSSITGGKATIDLGATIPRHAGSAFCGSSATLEGSAVVDTPEKIYID